MYKVTAISHWVGFQVFNVDTLDEAKELRKELRNHQYLVTIEEV